MQGCRQARSAAPRNVAPRSRLVADGLCTALFRHTCSQSWLGPICHIHYPKTKWRAPPTPHEVSRPRLSGFGLAGGFAPFHFSLPCWPAPLHLPYAARAGRGGRQGRGLRRRWRWRWWWRRRGGGRRGGDGRAAVAPETAVAVAAAAVAMAAAAAAAAALAVICQADAHASAVHAHQHKHCCRHDCSWRCRWRQWCTCRGNGLCRPMLAVKAGCCSTWGCTPYAHVPAVTALRRLRRTCHWARGAPQDRSSRAKRVRPVLGTSTRAVFLYNVHLLGNTLRSRPASSSSCIDRFVFITVPAVTE